MTGAGEILHNQFITGGFLLMASGAVMALLRQVPQRSLAWLRYRATVSVLITDRDPLFEWTKLWLDSLPYSKRARNVACSLYRQSDEEFSAQSRTVFTPAYGIHFFRHRRRLVWLERIDPKAGGGAEGSGAGSSRSRAPEAIRLTVLGIRQTALRAIIKEILEFAADDERSNVRAYISGPGWWQRMNQFQPRKLATVDLPASDEQRILAAIEQFLGARAVYAKRGIPYHLNFLFAGLPGTGKTSIAAALCGHFGLNLHLLNIAGPGMNDQTLVQLMLNLPRRSMVLMEDVDAIVPDRQTKPRSAPAAGDSIPGGGGGDSAHEGVTLSGLLNCMDGLTAPDGAIIVMTTNHPERLDPALLRPGRVDIRVDFGPAAVEQITRMCQRLLPGRHLNGACADMLASGYTTAQVQARLLSDESGKTAQQP